MVSAKNRKKLAFLYAFVVFVLSLLVAVAFFFFMSDKMLKDEDEEVTTTTKSASTTTKVDSEDGEDAIGDLEDESTTASSTTSVTTVTTSSTTTITTTEAEGDEEILPVVNTTTTVTTSRTTTTSIITTKASTSKATTKSTTKGTTKSTAKTTKKTTSKNGSITTVPYGTGSSYYLALSSWEWEFYNYINAKRKENGLNTLNMAKEYRDLAEQLAYEYVRDENISKSDVLASKPNNYGAIVYRSENTLNDNTGYKTYEEEKLVNSNILTEKNAKNMGIGVMSYEDKNGNRWHAIVILYY